MAISKLSAASFQDNVKFRNIIINGDMSIAQRGTSATGLGAGDNGYHTCDRWYFFESASPTYEFTQTQDSDVPTGQGFAKSLKMDCTTAQGSLASNDLLRIIQIIEGQNLQYLKYGTTNAQSLTASFWVKSNVTGNYNTHLYAGSATNRIITSTFTINSANTWEKKTITFAGDTAQAIINDNLGRLNFTITFLAGTDYTSTDGTSWGTYSSSKIAYGQTANVASSTSNYFNYTGIQLEAGQTASEFEFLPVDVNLQRCQRYCHAWGDYGAGAVNGNLILSARYGGSTASCTTIFYPTQMRVKPSLTYAIGGGGTVNTDYSTLSNLQLYDVADSAWYIYDVLAEAEL